ncbi:hypothetical protein [Auraticoccus monumenti]|uniref:Uncharacterized protein n=1 Tax=Auraticoccus monumenti TaxID=675864 RepID=A0A1G6UGF7_9ACTN|nr:hypothetical protein [Auraticoccus monumenti]SDD40490.1 hypothetical protein SAMN04489747_0881 [Auraticoccus monumenti]
MASGRIAQLIELRERVAQHFIPELLIALVAATSAGLGIVIAADPRVAQARSFGVTFTWLQPWVWSTLFLVLGVTCGVAGILRRSAAVLPALACTAVWALFAIATVLGVGRGGLLTAPVVYGGFAWVCALCALAATGKRGRP